MFVTEVYPGCLELDCSWTASQFKSPQVLRWPNKNITIFSGIFVEKLKAVITP